MDRHRAGRSAHFSTRHQHAGDLFVSVAGTVAKKDSTPLSVQQKQQLSFDSVLTREESSNVGGIARALLCVSDIWIPMATLVISANGHGCVTETGGPSSVHNMYANKAKPLTTKMLNLWRRGESNCARVLKTRKLLKNRG